ncbi:MAG: hypothetical protein ACYC9J_02085 [Sulfuricaulis sp.]
MKSVCRLAAPIMLLTLLVACVSTARFEQMMDGYIGMPLAELQRHFGYNYIERNLTDGNRAYTWVWKEKGVFPAYAEPTTIETYSSNQGQHVIVIPGTYFPETPYETSCEFSFIVNAAGQTLSWRAHGNGCAGFTGPGKVLESGKKP